MNEAPRKRQKREGISPQDAIEFEDDSSPLHDIWTSDYLFALLETHDSRDVDTSAEKNKNRAYDNVSEYGLDVLHEANWTPQEDVSDLTREYSLKFNPSVPSREDRPTQVEISNPFLDGAENRYPSLRQWMSELPKGGELSGYIRCRVKPTKPRTPKDTRCEDFLARKSPALQTNRRGLEPEASKKSISRLPPNFDMRWNLDSIDNMLFKFYTVAFCGGRTLLKKANFWLVEFAPMAAGDECVIHELLAFTAAYVLDYVFIDKFRIRANAHYKKAVNLLTDALSNPANFEVGKGDNLIAAVILLSSDDIVQWELQKPRSSVPRWRDGVQAAKKILDISDPGYRYWKAPNVQSSLARVANSNRVAFVEILAQVVTPLEAGECGSMYSWLLEGGEKEAQKIHDGTGLSPKLLHIFAQITHIAARMMENPDSPIPPHFAKEVERRLHNFKQWSDLSHEHRSTGILLDSCVLNAQGKVSSEAEVTELTAEAWVATAKLYLHCRFYRKPRSHPVVLGCLNVLRRCVEMMPSSGPLFTSQSPLCPIFIMGLISYRDLDRAVVRGWFETQCSAAKPRSSVPPVWRTLQSLWGRIDTELNEPPHDDSLPIGQRTPWWELVTNRIVETEGQLSLC